MKDEEEKDVKMKLENNGERNGNMMNTLVDLGRNERMMIRMIRMQRRKQRKNVKMDEGNGKKENEKRIKYN